MYSVNFIIAGCYSYYEPLHSANGVIETFAQSGTSYNTLVKIIYYGSMTPNQLTAGMTFYSKPNDRFYTGMKIDIQPLSNGASLAMRINPIQGYDTYLFKEISEEDFAVYTVEVTPTVKRLATE